MCCLQNFTISIILINWSHLSTDHWCKAWWTLTMPSAHLCPDVKLTLDGAISSLTNQTSDEQQSNWWPVFMATRLKGTSNECPGSYVAATRRFPLIPLKEELAWDLKPNNRKFLTSEFGKTGKASISRPQLSNEQQIFERQAGACDRSRKNLKNKNPIENSESTTNLQ